MNIYDILLEQWNSQWEILLNVLIAMVLGGLIGLERELAKKPAGFRTLMLVTGASAMLVGITDILIAHFIIDANENFVCADPVRIVGAIITGISFLGAGTIFRSGSKEGIEGLTTAASILICSVIGISVSLNLWILSVGITLFSIVILRAVAMLEQRMASRK